MYSVSRLEFKHKAFFFDIHRYIIYEYMHGLKCLATMNYSMYLLVFFFLNSHILLKYHIARYYKKNPSTIHLKKKKLKFIFYYFFFYTLIFACHYKRCGSKRTHAKNEIRFELSRTKKKKEETNRKSFAHFSRMHARKNDFPCGGGATSTTAAPPDISFTRARSKTY